MATKTKKLRVLNEIYDSLPSVECKGLCWTTCSFINITPIEEVNIETATGKPVETILVPMIAGDGMTPMIKPTEAEKCPYLQLNRCSIYAQRPLICRIFGTAEGLRCRHGCKPSRVISDKDVSKILKQLVKL
jgi:Fe-S-cluster containining protein